MSNLIDVAHLSVIFDVIRTFTMNSLFIRKIEGELQTDTPISTAFLQ